MTTTIPRICASIAGKASPLGVVIHDAAYRAAGLDYKYIAVEASDLEATVRALVVLNVCGFALSMPHKAAIIPMLTDTSVAVQAIGSCNTVVNDGGRLSGHNTDWRGAVDALDASGVTPPGKAMLVGSGGVARALAYGLRHRGWQVHVTSRNIATAQDLAARFQLPPPVAYGQGPYRSIDLVVNATPTGAHPGGALELDWFPDARALLDVVFIPVNTQLVTEARRRGWQVVPGWQMLLHQATYQFQLYTRLNPPIDAMREALLSKLPAQ